MSAITIALQLYTVRDLLARDYVGTLRRVKQIGYDVVQLTGNIPFEAEEARSILDDLGLSVAGLHVDGERLKKDLDHWADFARTVGTRDIIWPYVPEDQRRTREDWLALAKTMDGLGARCRAHGLRLSYHNHSFEFTKFDGVYALDLLFQQTDPDNLYAEIDTYWVRHGGEDPAAYIRRYAGRVPLLHVKDMAADERRSFAEVGRGILDWRAIHRASLRAGVECYAVEQDTCPGDPLESARISLEFLKKLVAS